MRLTNEKGSRKGRIEYRRTLLNKPTDNTQTHKEVEYIVNSMGAISTYQ